MKRNLPETSISAYNQVHQNMKNDHWGKIMFAMRMLNKPASMEDIMKYLKWDNVARVSRRMAELVRDGVVYVNGVGKTSSGRSCQLYSLTKHAEEKQDEEDSKFWDDLQSGRLDDPKPQFIQGALL